MLLLLKEQAVRHHAPCICHAFLLSQCKNRKQVRRCFDLGGEAELVWPPVESLRVVHFSQYRPSCESDTSLPPLFLFPLFYEAVIFRAPPSSHNRAKGRLGGKRFPGSNYEAAAEIRRYGGREFYFLCLSALESQVCLVKLCN